MRSNFVHMPKRSARSESGSIIILTALAMAVVLGIVAFAVDASFLYTERNRMSAAADAAAKAAALENQRSGAANLQTFANREVTMHGFDPGGTTSVVVHRPPVSGPFTGNSHYVEVLVSRPTDTFFARAFNAALGTITPLARAVAGTASPQNCLVTMQDLGIGNTTIGLNGCDVGVGGDLQGNNPNATISGTPTPGVSVHGSCTGTCGAMGTLRTNQPIPTNPMAGLAAPTVTGVNCPGGAPAATNPLPGGCYTNIPNSITQLQAGGIFQVSGTMNIDTLTGSNVLIYLTGTGGIQGGNNGSMTITASNTAPYAGIAIYGDPGSTLAANNNFTMSVTGAVYMPSTDVNFNNSLNLTATGCTLLIFNSLQIRNGNGALSNSGCSGLFGNAAFLGVALAE